MAHSIFTGLIQASDANGTIGVATTLIQETAFGQLAVLTRPSIAHPQLQMPPRAQCPRVIVSGNHSVFDVLMYPEKSQSGG